MLDFLLHIDKYMASIINHYHSYTYLILFGFIFIETGIVIAPFIPGDSLLFAAGALLAGGNTGLNLYLLAGILILAACAGDSVNYQLGKYFGPKIFTKSNRILKLEYYKRTILFFEKHGGMSIIFGRFMPLIRTFIPFVAGVSHMPVLKFTIYNLVGGIGWVISFLLSGYFFGTIPWIKNNFTIFVLIIVAVSLLPVIYTAFKKKDRQS